MELLKNLLQYLPYILLFAVATMLIYGWGLWRSLHQKQDLNNLLTSKGISKIKKELKRNGKMTKKELADCIQGLTAQQPFSKQRIGVTNPTQFLDSLLPYMERQEMITKTKEHGRVYYYLIHWEKTDEKRIDHNKCNVEASKNAEQAYFLGSSSLLIFPPFPPKDYWIHSFWSQQAENKKNRPSQM